MKRCFRIYKLPQRESSVYLTGDSDSEINNVLSLTSTGGGCLIGFDIDFNTSSILLEWLDYELPESVDKSSC